MNDYSNTPEWQAEWVEQNFGRLGEHKDTILEEAQKSVFGPRQGTYGHPREDFARIAALWTTYARALAETNLDALPTFRPENVADMMILLKMARLMQTPEHRDSIVDMAGYAETRARAVGVDA